ncbi:Mrr restriction system protein [Bradyrhizobium ivorense]|uniref:Mrr restriction system protein n=1 Tax=Bradyrhizobium ivorense TaxID=2511166 RepID=A0A508TK28_9BRAD|nr:restriction endonuclease [Bradyrhizobium ivorense]VIO74714.1 Mrr restriction system protein [Bradyrhizobium ivorense]
MSDNNVWGIHGGKTGDAESLFFKHDCVALGWASVGDLSKLKPDREAFKEVIAATYPEKKPGSVPVNAGQLFRFVHEVELGDLVVYPSKADRKIYVGKIAGGYLYDPTTEPTYPHRRAVKWLHSVPRTKFSQGALYEIGSAMSLFLVKNYADEFRAVVVGKAIPVQTVPVSEDETVAAVAEDVEESTTDYILKKLATDLKGHPFAEFVAHLLGTMGYRTRLSPEGPDGGVDIIAHKDELGFEPPIIKVQVKSSEGSVGDPALSALYGKVGHTEFGLFVTLGTFTNQAKSFAKGKSNLRLIDGQELVKLVFEHYQQFDARHKGLLALRQAYVPDVIETEDD